MIEGAAREKDQADFDLERFIDMFDEAMSSKDERVVNALRSLMMMVILTKNDVNKNPLADRNVGPLRRMYDDIRAAHRRISDVEDTVRGIQRTHSSVSDYERHVKAQGVWPKEDEQKQIWMKQAHEELERARQEAQSLGAIAGHNRVSSEILKKINSGTL